VEQCSAATHTMFTKPEVSISLSKLGFWRLPRVETWQWQTLAVNQLSRLSAPTDLD